MQKPISFFKSVPDNILANIFTRLNPTDLVLCKLVEKKWRQVIKESPELNCQDKIMRYYACWLNTQECRPLVAINLSCTFLLTTLNDQKELHLNNFREELKGKLLLQHIVLAKHRDNFYITCYRNGYQLSPIPHIVKINKIPFNPLFSSDDHCFYMPYMHTMASISPADFPELTMKFPKFGDPDIIIARKDLPSKTYGILMANAEYTLMHAIAHFIITNITNCPEIIYSQKFANILLEESSFVLKVIAAQNEHSFKLVLDFLYSSFDQQNNSDLNLKEIYSMLGISDLQKEKYFQVLCSHPIWDKIKLISRLVDNKTLLSFAQEKFSHLLTDADQTMKAAPTYDYSSDDDYGPTMW